MVIIIQLCRIKKGQSYNRKLNDLQTRDMLKIAKKDPHVLHREITEQVQNLDIRGPVPEAWGLKIEGNMLTFKETRVLNPPQLIYGQGTEENKGKGFATIVPGDGSWDINTTSFTFLTPKKIKNWGILAVGRCDNRDINDGTIK